MRRFLIYTGPGVVNETSWGEYTEEYTYENRKFHAGQAEEIAEAIRDDLDSIKDDAPRGLIEYCDVAGCESLTFKDVVNINEQFFLSWILKVNEDFRDEDMEKFKDWISGQMSDGWGEGFEQHPFETSTYEDYVDVEDYDEESGETNYTQETDHIHEELSFSPWSYSKNPREEFRVEVEELDEISESQEKLTEAHKYWALLTQDQKYARWKPQGKFSKKQEAFDKAEALQEMGLAVSVYQYKKIESADSEGARWQWIKVKTYPRLSVEELVQKGLEKRGDAPEDFKFENLEISDTADDYADTYLEATKVDKLRKAKTWKLNESKFQERAPISKVLREARNPQELANRYRLDVFELGGIDISDDPEETAYLAIAPRHGDRSNWVLCAVTKDEIESYQKLGQNRDWLVAIHKPFRDYDYACEWLEDHTDIQDTVEGELDFNNLKEAGNWFEQAGRSAERYKDLVGKKIQIIDMEGEPRYNSKIGVVEFVDSIGQLHGTWGGCAVIPGHDFFKVLSEKLNERLAKVFYEVSHDFHQAYALARQFNSRKKAEAYYDQLVTENPHDLITLSQVSEDDEALDGEYTNTQFGRNGEFWYYLPLKDNHDTMYHTSKAEPEEEEHPFDESQLRESRSQIDLLYSSNGFRPGRGGRGFAKSNTYAVQCTHPDNVYQDLKYYLKQDGSKVYHQFRVNIRPCALENALENSISVKEFMKKYEAGEFSDEFKESKLKEAGPKGWAGYDPDETFNRIDDDRYRDPWSNRPKYFLARSDFDDLRDEFKQKLARARAEYAKEHPEYLDEYKTLKAWQDEASRKYWHADRDDPELAELVKKIADAKRYSDYARRKGWWSTVKKQDTLKDQLQQELDSKRKARYDYDNPESEVYKTRPAAEHIDAYWALEDPIIDEYKKEQDRKEQEFADALKDKKIYLGSLEGDDGKLSKAFFRGTDDPKIYKKIGSRHRSERPFGPYRGITDFYIAPDPREEFEDYDVDSIKYLKQFNPYGWESNGGIDSTD